MDRWACVDLPAFALQLLLRRRPELRGRPVALVDREVYHAPVRLVSRAARRAGVRPGMKAPAAASLCPGLTLSLVPPGEVRAGRDEVMNLLRTFSPRVEPFATERDSELEGGGTFLLDPNGLERLFGAPETWCSAIADDLVERELLAHVALASNRIAAVALSRDPTLRTGGQAPVVVLPPAQEEARLRLLPLRTLGLPAHRLTPLARLGVRTVGDFVDLPPGGLSRRFGEELALLHRALHGDDPTPLAPARQQAPTEVTLDVEPATADAHRLLFLVRGALPPLLGRLAAAGEALSALHLTLEPGGSHRLEPAGASLDDRLLSDLVRLHLAGLSLEDTVECVHLGAETAPASAEQLELFAGRGRRDAHAVSRALARLRAAYGSDCTRRARLVDDHVPERSFRWEPLRELTALPPDTGAPPGEDSPPTDAARAGASLTAASPTVVRALLPEPRRLGPHPPRGRPLAGPHIIEGDWWMAPLAREYHFVEAPDGSILWLYYDAEQKSWYLQGTL